MFFSSLVVVACAALPCDARRANVERRLDPFENFLFALSGPVGQLKHFRSGAHAGRFIVRSSTPRQQYRGPPDSWMNRKKEWASTTLDRKVVESKDMRGVVTPTARRPSQRDAEAGTAEQIETRGSDAATEGAQPSQDVKSDGYARREAERAWAAAAKQTIEENVAPQIEESEEQVNEPAQEKSLVELLTNELSVPDLSVPTVDARAARLYLPFLAIAGLAAGTALDGKGTQIALPSLPSFSFPDPSKFLPAEAPPAPPVATIKPPPVLTNPRDAEAALKTFFPGALDSITMDRKVAEVLFKRGYTSANTLFASSMCPDEVNHEPGDVVDLMKSRWGEKFELGGLAGLPFVGKSGFTAYAHHVPDGGKLLVLFAPHVGINFDGKVGKLQRLNQKSLSTACGAAIGAYNGIMKEALAKKKVGDSSAVAVPKPKTRNDFDGQIEYIKAKLQPLLQGIEAAPDEIAFVTYQMYAIVRQFLIDQVLTADVWRDAGELCVVGGIMVNLGDGNDRFVPLFFQAREGEKGDVIDLYKEAFGDKPDLSYVLGDKAKAANFYKYDLNTLSMTAEEKMLKLFPGAINSASIDQKVWNTLSKYGYTSENTLLATSTCPDEVNTKQGEMMELLKSRWGENFALGGLAGLPFVGKAGFGAYAHHVPDNGKLFIVFAPHVGIDFDGKVGALKRLSQKGVSTACGAAIGAYNGIIKEALDKKPLKVDTPFKVQDSFDTQIEYIKTKLRARMGGIDNAPDPIAFVTYQMYAIVREFVDEVLTASDLLEVAAEICILGGIQINGEKGDNFMPLLFESKKAGSDGINDLYAETFGYRPDISYALGDKAKAKSFYATDLRALS